MERSVGAMSSRPTEPNDISDTASKQKTEETKSKWDFLKEEQTPKTRPQKPKQESKSRSSREKSKGSGPLLGPGMGLGAVAPVDPMYLEHREYEKTAGVTQQRTQTRISSRGLGGSRPQATNLLELPIEYMPFTDLGKDFPKIQVRNINNSYFQFAPGQGQMLCLLLWALPTEGSSSSPRSTSRTRPSRSRGRGGMGPGGMGMEMEMEMRTGGQGSSRSQQEMFPEVGYDLWTNAEQFNELFGAYNLNSNIPGIAGRIEFLGINFDKANVSDKSEIANILLAQPWPWSNCMFDDSVNHPQLGGLTGASPVMMIVGVDGKIRYVGPVGGILPKMLLNKELEETVAAATDIMPMTPPVQGKKPSLLGVLFGPTGPAEKPEQQQPQTQKEKPIQPISMEDQPSIHQAQQMLQQAYMQKRIGMKNKSLEFCDTIMEKWPDSIESEKAKELIKSIIRSNPDLKTQRQQQGKFTDE